MINCLFCDRSSPKTIPKGWDWFTGYFDRTAHFCPARQKQHWREVSWSYRKALFRPTPPAKVTSLDAALEDLRERQDDPV